MDADRPYRVESSEVLYSTGPLTAVGRPVVEALKSGASANSRRRIRLCAHDGPADRLHEMLIVHEQGAYVRPHRHRDKTESMHIIEGAADLVVFGDAGDVRSVTRLGDYASGETFFHRMAVPLFHTLLVRSDVFVFHETTNGPFDRRETDFAPWAPGEGDIEGMRFYLAGLEERLGRRV